MRQITRLALAALAGGLVAAAPAAALADEHGHPNISRAAHAGLWVEGWSAAASVQAKAGGDLFIPGVVRVHIPAGALPEDMVVYVRAEVVHVDGQAFLAFTFGPDGTVFNRPLTVTVSPRLIRGMNLTPGQVWYDAGSLADGNLNWVPAGATAQTGPANNRDGLDGERYVFEVHHFSRYALGSIVWSGQWW